MEEIQIERYSNGNLRKKMYYKNNKLHRKMGPAWVVYFKNGEKEYEVYFINGECHRENGPAYIEYYENGEIKKEAYFINGEQIIDEFQLLVIKGLEKT